MPTYCDLKGVSSAADELLSGQLGANLKLFLDWALLGTGQFSTVTLPAAPTTTAGAHRLRPSDDPSYTAGQVWEGFRKDWVWETGRAGPDGRLPVSVSGVWVNGSFKSLDSTGTYEHSVDHPNGRVIFTSPVPTGSHVAAEYSYRHVQVYVGEPDWFRRAQLEADWADPQFLQQGSGAWSVMVDARVQATAVVVRPLAGTTHSPYGLGSSANWVTQPVALSVLGDDPGRVGWLHDALMNQQDHNLRLFDVNEVLGDDAWPLNDLGGRKGDAVMYPQLVAETGSGGYLWRKASVEKTLSQERMALPPLRRADVLWQIKTDLP